MFLPNSQTIQKDQIPKDTVSEQTNQQNGEFDLVDFDDDNVMDDLDSNKQDIMSQQNISKVGIRSNHRLQSTGLDNLNSSFRSRNSHNSMQKEKLERFSRGNSHSPLKKNDMSFQKDDDNIDFSQFGQQDGDDQFSYKIDATIIELPKQDIQSNDTQIQNEQKQDMFGLSKIMQDHENNKSQFDEDNDDVDLFSFNKIETKKKQVQFVDDSDKINQTQIFNNKDNKILQQPQTQQSQQQKIITNPTPVKPQVWTKIEITNHKQFLFQPVPEGKILQCYIERDKSGLAYFYPRYHLYISETNQYLMSIKKLAGQKTSKYLMTFDKNEFSRKNNKFLGFLKSNFLGTEFIVYDKGVNPKHTQDYSLLRNQLAIIQYSSSPRKFRVVIPAVFDNQPIIYKPLQSRDGLILESLMPEKLDQTYHEFLNKLPIWDQKRKVQSFIIKKIEILPKGFVLHFNERVNSTSVKNFQLQRLDRAEKLSKNSIIQFGKYKNKNFNLDIQHPFNILQSFALCISTFDTKLGCD